MAGELLKLLGSEVLASALVHIPPTLIGQEQGLPAAALATGP